MIPDNEFSNRLATEEVNRLAEKIKELTPSDKDDIYRKGLELISKQEFKEGIFILD